MTQMRFRTKTIRVGDMPPGLARPSGSPDDMVTLPDVDDSYWLLPNRRCRPQVAATDAGGQPTEVTLDIPDPNVQAQRGKEVGKTSERSAK